MKVVVARVDDFPDGDRKIIDVNGRSVGVFRLGSRFYAIRNLCPHHHGPLCRGFIEQHVSSSLPGQVSIVDGVPMIACPWHGWEYDMETGQSWLGPGKGPGHIDARSYDIEIEKGAQVLEEEKRGEAAPAGPGPDGRMPGPYKADLVEVYIEDDFVVIDD
jgi:nitrite reductase/ring-hydroxylating ferredoxin subunit